MFAEQFIFEKEWSPREVPPPPHLDLRCHASTITELANGDLLAAWWEGSYETAKDVIVAGARRKAEEERWSETFALADTPGESDGNSVLFTAPDGRVWLFYVTMYGSWWHECKVRYITSDDNGYTWSQPVSLRDELGWMLRNKPIVLSSGRIVLPMYNEAAPNDKVNNFSFMLLSDDNGKTWRASKPIASSPASIQPTVIERSDGSLLAFSRYFVYPIPGDDGRIWMSTSTDGGETWTPNTRTSLLNSNAGIDMVKTASGNLVLAYNDSTSKRTPLKVALSIDEGATWQYQKTIETAEGKYDYPAIIQGRDGRLHLTYSYKRLTIKHVTFDEAWLLS